MAVYVDDMQAPFGRMLMCHMLADTDEELHTMAHHIGVQRKWWQSPEKTSGSHYDIALSKKALALAAGAIAITWRQAGAMNFRRKVTGSLGPPETAVEWMHVYKRNPGTPIANALPSRAGDKTGSSSRIERLTHGQRSLF